MNTDQAVRKQVLYFLKVAARREAESGQKT
jgi:hypothetical protein